MIIRDVKLTDVPAMARVHVDSWRTHYRGIMDQAFLDNLDVHARAERWSKALSDANNPNVTLVGEIQNKVVGFISVGPSRKDFYSGWGELLALYLDTGEQKKGLGRMLFSAGETRLKQMSFSKFYLWVLKDNPTRGFYERVGGKLGRTDSIVIGDQKLDEVSYEFNVSNQA
jgi:ribosomal protein S18 acetylase RimI-like enzyme